MTIVQRLLSVGNSCINNIQDMCTSINENCIQPGFESGIFQGYPVTVLTSLGAGYIFGCASPMTAVVFGTVNYLAITIMAELSRQKALDNDDKEEVRSRFIFKITTIPALAYFISKAFIETICKTPMNYQAALILAVASLSGQIVRDRLISNRDQY